MMLLYEDHFFLSKFGDDSRFLSNALNGEFDISDLYPNSLFLTLVYSFTGSIKASIILLKLLLLVLSLYYIKYLTDEVKVHYGIVCLFILSSSDFFFISSYNMRDIFLMLAILMSFQHAGKVKSFFLGIVMLVIRPVSMVFLLFRLRNVTIFFIGIIGAFIYFSPLKNDVLKLFLTPGAYLAGMTYEIEDVIEIRNEQISESGSSLGDGVSSIILKPAVYLTRPLLFNDWRRPIKANNEYENREYVISGFDTDLLFQNFAVLANMIYLPFLLFSLVMALIKGDRIGWLYVLFLSVFSIVSFGQSRHHLMFNFLELVIIYRYVSEFHLLYRVIACLSSCILIVLLNIF